VLRLTQCAGTAAAAAILTGAAAAALVRRLLLGVARAMQADRAFPLRRPRVRR
jgi:hypothetical protein